MSFLNIEDSFERDKTIKEYPASKKRIKIVTIEIVTVTIRLAKHHYSGFKSFLQAKKDGEKAENAPDNQKTAEITKEVAKMDVKESAKETAKQGRKKKVIKILFYTGGSKTSKSET